MTETFCLFCNCADKAYKLVKSVEFVCGLCVQILLDADKNDLKRAYTKAIKLGLHNKAKAINIFLSEEQNEQRKPKNRIYERYISRS